MIELVNTFIVGSNQTELEALQVLLLEGFPDLTFSITENEVEAGEDATYTMLVQVDGPVFDFSLPFLLEKIEEINHQSS